MKYVNVSEEKFETAVDISSFTYHPPITNRVFWDKPRFLFYIIGTTWTLATTMSVGVPLVHFV